MEQIPTGRTKTSASRSSCSVELIKKYKLMVSQCIYIEYNVSTLKTSIFHSVYMWKYKLMCIHTD
ncbi:hypothetical protein OUZ56_012704 [Daphnia magna]|uniref:Uncharacterized protein n=1 Tax=Daphnia magna TaxID=35525 RepID=A0ABQ9Z3T7_9CRUS|nr:hypothetical protein OUZ56_012704 [Daphnia magna]